MFKLSIKMFLGHISTNSCLFFMIQGLKIKIICVWVRSSTWRDERLVETGLDWFFSVFRFFGKPCNWHLKNFRICATATDGPVFCSWVQFNFGQFFGPVNWTCEHYLFLCAGCCLWVVVFICGQLSLFMSSCLCLEVVVFISSCVHLWAVMLLVWHGGGLLAVIAPSTLLSGELTPLAPFGSSGVHLESWWNPGGLYMLPAKKKTLDSRWTLEYHLTPVESTWNMWGKVKSSPITWYSCKIPRLCMPPIWFLWQLWWYLCSCKHCSSLLMGPMGISNLLVVAHAYCSIYLCHAGDNGR